MSSPILRLESVSKTFGHITALRNVDLTVPRGDVFGIVGPDAAGKSTLIRLAMGILRLDSGRLTLLGSDSPREVRRAVGYVPQHFSLYTNLTVLENIHLYGSLYGAGRREVESTAKEVLTRTELWAFRDRLAGNLSGGMKQKLSLAAGLVHKPEILFLDEPTTGVDPVARREFWSMLYELGADGVTIIVSTPYMDEAELCAQLAFLHNGVLLKQGTADELLASYPHSVLDVEANSGNLRDLEKLLAACAGVKAVNLFGTRCHVETDDLSATLASIKTRAAQAKIAIEEISQIPPTIEDLFVFLASGTQTEERDSG